MADLSVNAQKIMELVENLSVIELSDLVKALEEKFGVSASAPVMMAAGPAVAEEKGPEKTIFDVVIKEIGAQKIAVVKAVREIDQSLGLIDANNLVGKPDAVVLKQAKKEAAEEAKKKLEAAGAKVELV